MDPLEGMDSSTDDDAASQTTEDDPQVPEQQVVQPPAPAPVPPPSQAQAGPSTNGTALQPARERPHYELKHTLPGHSMSISSVKFSPDGMLLASCCTSFIVDLAIWSYQDHGLDPCYIFTLEDSCR